jgi:pyruvate dehydrogenase E2 component (dihydrolipoamide acetyltransferase)
VEGLESLTREITIPSLGVAMEDALIVAWLKEEGDDVEADEPVVEIETDKSTMELVAPVAGRLGPHLFDVGAIVPVGAALVKVYDPDGEPETVEAEPAEPTPETPAASPPAGDLPSGGLPAPAAGREPHRISPRARRAAMLAGAAAPPPAASAPAGGGRFRELIAAKVSESWRTIPHFTVVREIDVERLGAELRVLKASGRACTVTDLLLRAHALALAGEPDADPQQDIGLAVASENGVMIPVVRDVLGRTLESLSSAREAAVKRGRECRLSADDLELPRSTLSNLGSFAVDAFTGIVAPGQTTLLTVGRIKRVPSVVGDEVVPRDLLVATVNADHRALDGADAARLLTAFAAHLEDPARVVAEGAIVV